MWLRSLEQKALRRARGKRARYLAALVRYTGDCVCTHEGAIRPQCMAGIFGVDCGTHMEFTSTGCEFDTVTLLAKRPAR